jgi:catecholate siderophore receptor
MAPRFRLKQSVLSAAVLAALAASAQGQTTPSREPAEPEATRPQPALPGPVAQASDKPGVTVLPEVKVEGESAKQKNETRSGTRTETPLRDIPQFINTVPETVLKQQGATTLQDALRNVPGISYAAPEGGTQANTLYYLRGVPAGGDLFVDGLRDVGEYTRDIFNVETVEVLKGPSALTFGRGSTGGVINEVARMPSLFGRSEVSATLGTFEKKRATADINVKTGATSAMRFVAMGEDSSSYRYPQDVERQGFAPSLRIGIGTDTELSLAHMYLRTKDVTDYGQPTLFTAATGFMGFAPISAENYYGFANHDFANHTTNMTTARIEHRFGTLVSLRNTLRWATYERQMESTIPSLRATDANGAPVTASTPLELLMVTRNHDAGRSRDNDDDALINQTELTWRFGTGGMRHTLLTGLELARERLNRQNYALDADPLTPFIQTPTAATPLLDPDPFTQLSYTKSINQKAKAKGETAALYVQDQMDLTKTLKALLGLRFERYKANAETMQVTATATVPSGTAAFFDRTDNMLSSRAGLIWQPTDNASYYISWGNSYNPSGELGVYGATGTNLSLANENLDPEKNQNYEIGSQWDVGAMRIKASVFRNEKTNARMADPVNAGQTILAGKRRVDGVELEFSGSITSAWDIYSGIAYMDGKIVKGPANVEGKRPLGVASLSGSVWTVYRIGGGFEVGGGVRGTTGSYLTDTNLAKVPGYHVWDLTAAYVQPNYEVRLNANNVTDELYYYGGYQNSPSRVLPGAPRMYTMTVRYMF